MDILTLIVVGLVAGLIASFAVGGIGYGLVGDLVIGMAGALLGGWLFRVLHIHNPAHGVGGSILVASIGAIGLLVIVRALRRIPRRRLI